MGHAYLVAAHHQMQLLQILLHLIDDERNEIYLHVDKKCKEKDIQKQYRFMEIYINNVRWNIIQSSISVAIC